VSPTSDHVISITDGQDFLENNCSSRASVRRSNVAGRVARRFSRNQGDEAGRRLDQANWRSPEMAASRSSATRRRHAALLNRGSRLTELLSSRSLAAKVEEQAGHSDFPGVTAISTSCVTRSASSSMPAQPYARASRTAHASARKRRCLTSARQAERNRRLRPRPLLTKPIGWIS